MGNKTRVIRLVVAVVSVIGTLAASASAVTWHQTGDTAFTGSANTMQYGAGGITFQCLPGAMTGTAGASGTGTVWTAAQLTVTWSCPINNNPWYVHCRFTFTANGQDGATTTGFSHTTCVLGIGDAVACQWHGTDATSYDNPTATTTGLFHVAPMSTFVLTNGYATGSPTTCPYGTGANGAFTGMTAYTNVGTGGPAPHHGPVITRTG